jgi:hypothetical protein
MDRGDDFVLVETLSTAYYRHTHYSGPICQDTLGPTFKESSFPFKQAGSA